MIDLRKTDFSNKPKTSSGAFINPLDVLADIAREAYCGIYASEPIQFINRYNATDKLMRSVMNRVCADALATPPAPTVPFTGGQESGREYGWIYQRPEFENGEFIGWKAPDITRGGGITGRIYSVTLKVNGVILAENYHWSYVGKGFQPFLNDNSKRYDIEVVTENSVENRLVTTSFGCRFLGFVPLGAGEDTSGDPSPEFDYKPPLSSNRLQGTTEIIQPDGSTISYSYQLSTNGDGRLGFPFSFKIEGGIKATVDAGGIVFENDESYAGGVGQPPSPVKKPEEEEPPETVEKEPEEDDDSAEKETIDKIVALKIELSGVPSNAKRHSGGLAPDVIFAGWMEWQIDGYCFPRVRIDFNKNYYPAPEGATGYAYTVKKGFTAIITEVIEQVSIEPDSEQS